MAVKRKRAIFLDKDGTLIKDVPYNVRPSRVWFYPDAASSLGQLQSKGYLLIIVSNQSGVARGMFPEAEARKTLGYVQEQLNKTGVAIEDYFYCPHHPNSAISKYRAACDCRKPAPGLLLKAAAKHGIDLSESWMIGDILDDVEAGNRAGCRSILIDNGNETEWKKGPYRIPVANVDSLTKAANLILSERGAA